MADELDTKIQENAAGPKRARGDSGEVEQHSIADQIAADRYLASKAAMKQPHRGLRLTKLQNSPRYAQRGDKLNAMFLSRFTVSAAGRAGRY